MTHNDVHVRDVRPPRVIVRGLWQTVNIGDVAHAPGVLRALQRSWPEAELVLWPRALEDRERDLLGRFLPDVRVVEGELGADGQPSTRALADAFATADLLIHSSGPSLAAADDVRRWRAATGRPYGFFGVTVDPLWPLTGGTLDELAARIAALPADHLPADKRDLLDGAAFVFCRDAISLAYLRAQSVEPGLLEFGPDATFAFDLRDDAAADRILAEHGLRTGGFLGVVPRLRYTPYHHIRALTPTDEDRRRDAVNAEHLDHDLGQLRDVIAGWVRRTGRDVLACPEMTYQVDLNRDELVDKLPADVAPHVKLLSGFWGPHEAAAVYAQAAAVLSQECHSPILAIAADTPAVYVRNPTDSVKGQMYDELGLAAGLFEVERTTSDELLTALLDDHAAVVSATGRAREAATRHLDRMVTAASAAVTGTSTGPGTSAGAGVASATAVGGDRS